MQKYQDAFLLQDITKVKSVEEKESYLIVEFEDTVFYPGGGGQPCDKGIVKTNIFLGEVTEVFKENERVLHKIKPIHGELKIGDNSELKVNDERRIKLVRMHTGEHILFKSLEQALGNIKLNKIDLDENESSLFIDTEKLTWDDLFRAEAMVNSIIDEDRQIMEKEYQREDAIKFEKLRIKADRILSDKIRVIEIKDFDWSACTGTHAKSTGFIGNLLITKFNLNKGSYEIRFKTNVKDDFFILSRSARETASILGVDTSNVLITVKKLQEESLTYKEKFRRLSSGFLDYNKEESIGKIRFIYNLVEEIEKKQLVDKAAELAKERTIVCFVNKTEGKAVVLLSASPDLELDIPELLNKGFFKFGGKGGGRGSFAMGSVDEIYAQDVLDELKSIIMNSI